MERAHHDPSGRREHYVFPRVNMTLANMEQVKGLTWREEEHLILHETENLIFPLAEIQMEVFGSRDEDGEYGYHSIIRIHESDDDDDRPDSFFEELTVTLGAEPLDDQSTDFLITTLHGYQFRFLMEDEGTLFRLQSAGSNNSGGNIAQRSNRQLQHGQDNPLEALQEYLSMNQLVLSHLLRTYDKHDAKLDLTIRPIEPLTQGKHNMLQLNRGAEQAGVRLDDLGGFEETKEALMETVLALRHPEIMEAYSLERPHGIFLYGPPGTGKTSLAEAVATELDATLKTVRSSDIYGKWMGESEQKFKAILDEARSATNPYVLLFDEVDGIVRPAAGSAYATVATQFKQQIGRLSKENPNVVVIATSNQNPDAIDEALFRAGRFDKHIYVPLPNEQDRRAIFGTIAARYAFGSEREVFDFASLDLVQLAVATDELSGADITEIMRKAVAAKAMFEIRTKTQPEPLTTDELMAAVYRFRQTKA